MSRKERNRLEVFGRVKSRHITQLKASELLGLSYRQVLRMYQRYMKEGACGLVHKLRGRDSNRGRSLVEREKILSIYQEHYGDFGPTLACEQMGERQRVAIDHETLRRWLVKAGVWKGVRKRQKHRSRRERMAHPGELVQLDGSQHAWLEDRGPGMSLIELVEDATGITYGRFYREETTEAVMDCFGRYVGQHGLPRALYVDQDSIYVVNNREATAAEVLEHREPITQFGRAAAELSVKIVVANSPQAKGRVERVHGTQQDRLVKLLRLEKISTMEGANEYLEKRYWSDYHVRFGRRALGADIHRQLPAKMDLRQILCFKEERTVGRDWCVCYQKRVLQIGSKHQSLALAWQRVEVREHLDGTIELYYRGRVLAHYELPARPTGGQWRPVFQNNKVYRPPAEHPYKRGYVAPPAQHGNVTVLMS